MAHSCCKIDAWILCLFILLSAVPFHHGFTDPRDVFAITQLHASLGLPLLPGWIPGGDPCGPPSWQGVVCVNANITQLNLINENLGGELPEDMGMFASLIFINVGNNHIGGSMPTSFPITIENILLSNNQFTGHIPDTISSLGQLRELQVDLNQLTGSIPDAFEPLTNLHYLDLSDNNLTGGLPPSMGGLSSLTSLYLNDNQLTGVLDVLQDLPLENLWIIDNFFSGPIPNKLLKIPTFRRAGNPFNTTILPSPPTAPPLSPIEPPSPQLTHGASVNSVSSPLPQSTREEKNNASQKIKWIVLGGLFAVLILVFCLFLSVREWDRWRKFSRQMKLKHKSETSLPKTIVIK